MDEVPLVDVSTISVEALMEETPILARLLKDINNTEGALSAFNSFVAYEHGDG